MWYDSRYVPSLKVRRSVLPALRTRVPIHMARIISQSSSSTATRTTNSLVLSDCGVARVYVVVSPTHALLLLVPSPEQNRNRTEENRTAHATNHATDDALGLA